jgi:hypothetical protein
MATHRQRFVTGPDAGTGWGQLGVGLRHSLQLALTEPPQPLLLTFSTKGNLDNVYRALAPVLGDAALSRLSKAGETSTPIPMAMITDRTASHCYEWNGPVLLVYPTATMLNHVGELRGVTAEVVVPWTDTQAGDWIRAWSPMPLGSAKAASPIAPPPPEVVYAIRSLTGFVNPVNGLKTRADREETIGVIETISHYCPSFSPSDLRAWLVGSLKWDGEMASEAESIHNSVRDGKRPRGSRGPDARSWEYWGQRAREAE